MVAEADLVRALQGKLLGGAGLDVLEKEPPDEDCPLLAMENVILTPHSAALTGECVLEMAVRGVERAWTSWTGPCPTASGTRRCSPWSSGRGCGSVRMPERL